MKETLKPLIPLRIWKTLAYLYSEWYQGTQWTLSGDCQTSVKRLQAFKDTRRGQRCFIIGNGPSLKTMNLRRLHHECTFGLNGIYLLFPELGFTTTYLVAVDCLVLEQRAEAIAQLSMPKFLGWTAKQWIPFDDHTMLLRSTLMDLGFSKDPSRYIFEGSTVTYVAMQLAFYMGFQKVILIGIDHNFAKTGAPHQEVVSEGNDPEHFSKNYLANGFRWHLPDYETMEAAYRMARVAFEQDGRKIVDATVDGKLNVFPKISYDSLF